MSELEQSSAGKKEYTQDVEDQEMISHTETPHSAVHANSQEPIPDTENQKVEMQSEELDKNKGKTEPEYSIKRFNSKIAGFWVQTLASIATVVMAILAWRTLIEMQTERNNAYRPEIVIMQNTFEGGQISLSEEEISGNYTYFDPYAPAPSWAIQPEFESISDEAYYLESPYLTLKNIGQGTAKDVRVTFQINDWLKKAVDYLNESDEGPYKFEEHHPNPSDQDQSRCHVIYRKSTEEIPIVFIASYIGNEKDYANITYIASGEDSVDVKLPDSWCEMLGAIYSLSMQFFASLESAEHATMNIVLPDLPITIQYSDMQGKQYKQEESIPWKACARHLRTTDSAENENQSLYLWINIYDDYIR